MANQNDIPFATDIHGICSKLRDEGIKACHRIYDESQLTIVRDTLKCLSEFAKDCLEDRKAYEAQVLAERAAAEAPVEAPVEEGGAA
jgi:hypothetical protein